MTPTAAATQRPRPLGATTVQITAFWPAREANMCPRRSLTIVPLTVTVLPLRQVNGALSPVLGVVPMVGPDGEVAASTQGLLHRRLRSYTAPFPVT